MLESTHWRGWRDERQPWLAINALAMVPSPGEVRIRAALAPPGRVSVRLRVDGFVDAVERGWPDVAVVDPTLANGIGRIPATLRDARMPAVLYAVLTPDHARAAIEFLRCLPASIVIYGYGDDAAAFAAIIEGEGRATRGERLLERLATPLAALPSNIANGIAAANHSYIRLLSARQLACYCRVHRATLARALGDAGLGSPARFVRMLGLVQHFDFLADPTIEVDLIARRLGVASSSALARRCMVLSGFHLSRVRAGLTFETFCDACIERLT